MKKYVKVNLILMAVGIILMVVGSVMFAAQYKKWTYDTISYEETLDVDDWYDADTLEIDMAFSSLKIVEGDELKLTATDVNEYFQAKLVKKDDKICVESKNMSFRGKGLINTGSWNVDFGNGEYVLTIPDKIENWDIEFAFGNIIVERCTTEKAKISNNFSHADIELAVSEKLDVEASFCGTYIDMMNEPCEKVNFECAFGDVDLKSAVITDKGAFNMAFGDLFIQLIGDDYNVKQSTALGYSNVDGNDSDGKVKINSDNAFGNTDIRIIEE